MDGEALSIRTSNFCYMARTPYSLFSHKIRFSIYLLLQSSLVAWLYIQIKSSTKGGPGSYATQIVS